MFKKSISLILALALICAAFAVLPASAAEAEEDSAEALAAVGNEPVVNGDNETDIIVTPTTAETERDGRFDTAGGYLEYKIDLIAGTVTITGGKNLEGELVIPSEIEGYPVTALAERSLIDQGGVTAVTVPDSVTSIGEKALGYFTNETHGDADFTIKGSETGAAAAYADENGFDFVDVNADKYPHITSFENTETGVRIKWSVFAGAESYRVYYKGTDGGWVRLTSTTQREYTDTSAKGGETRVYTVRALKGSDTFVSDYSRRGWSHLFIEAPTVTLSNDEDGVMIEWKPCKGAERYRVYYYGSKGWTRMAETTDSFFLDTDVRSGNTYTYTVRCITADSSVFTSDYRAGKKIRYVAAPRITSFENTETGVRIKWDAVKGADFYRIYYKNGNGGWNRLASKYLTEYVDTSVKGGETRTYTIRCLNENEDFVSDFVHAGWSNTFIEAPTVTLSNDEDGVMIEWKPCKGAERYRVYYYGSKGWTRMAETTDSFFLDTDVRSGNTYTYTVRCITPDGKSFVSDYRAGKKIRYVAAPRITSFENTEDGAVIRWDAVKGADFYRIYYKNKDGGWNRLASKYLTEYTDTSVKEGETRTYTIRCLNENEDFVSDFVHAGWENTYHGPPAISSVSASGSGNLIKWEAGDGVAAYRLYRKTLGGSWGRLFDSTADTSYQDNTVEKGKIYAYTLRYMNEDGDLISGYREHVRYYKDGKAVSGKVESGGVYYFDDGYLYTGFKRIDGKLYCFSDSGKMRADVIVKSGSDYYYADKNGVCWETKEMRLAAEFLERYCKGSTLKDKMKYGFMYLANNYPYQRVYNDMPTSEKDIAPFASELFELKKGTCYRYASGFAYLAKIAGYRTRFCFGYQGVLQHGWTEVYVDGRWLICDVDAQLPGYHFADYEVYMLTEHVWPLDKKWHSELSVSGGKASWDKLIYY